MIHINSELHDFPPPSLARGHFQALLAKQGAYLLNSGSRLHQHPHHRHLQCHPCLHLLGQNLVHTCSCPKLRNTAQGTSTFVFFSSLLRYFNRQNCKTFKMYNVILAHASIVKMPLLISLQHILLPPLHIYPHLILLRTCKFYP